ncbi:MAG: hypothetical protein E7134_06560 [Rikenellaceae bacterium]|nr:hypothetical protein [Rikenellaceae bacterium]
MNEPNIIIDETIVPESRRCELSIGHGCEFCHCEGQDMCATAKEGCYKLHEYDWLAPYPDNGPTDIVEVRFKNTHRSYYANVNNLPLAIGDIVAVEASPGHDIGIVSLTGDMVARQMKRVGFNPQNGEFRKVYRKARPYDIEKWHEAVGREHEVMIRSRQIAADMGLDMKIGDVEFQGDGIKAIFYYIADERVDFRELIKVFADQFRIRIEMKQIGARQEAGRIGGLGACGRQLCCASWISSFNSVTTNAARTQDLSLNPQKLAGQCSKLKCCLTYELDDYIDARKEFPRLNGPLQALDADYFHVKNDILARTMSFSTQPGSMAGLVTLSIGRVREIMRLNAEGKKPEKITSDTVVDVTGDEPTYVNVIGEDSITRFDKAKRNKKRKNKNNKGGDQRAKEQQAEQQPKADKVEKTDKSDKAEKPQQQAGGDKPKGENKPQQGDRHRNNRGGRHGNNRGGRNNNNRHNREGGSGNEGAPKGGGNNPQQE